MAIFIYVEYVTHFWILVFLTNHFKVPFGLKDCLDDCASDLGSLSLSLSQNLTSCLIENRKWEHFFNGFLNHQNFSKILVGSQWYRLLLQFIFSSISCYTPMWLNFLMDDCNFGYHIQNSREKKNTPRSSGLKNYFFWGGFFSSFSCWLKRSYPYEEQ